MPPHPFRRESSERVAHPVETNVHKNTFFQLKSHCKGRTSESKHIADFKQQQPEARAGYTNIQRRAPGPSAAVGHPPERLRWAAAPDAANTGTVEDWILQKAAKEENGEMKYFTGEKEDSNNYSMIYSQVCLNHVRRNSEI